MIARITGKLIETGLTEIVVDVHGVGYKLFIPMSTYDKLPREGNEVSLLTHTHVREDALQLYGFATEDEKSLFELLISVSGIGAKLALNILSSMTVSSFCSAVSNKDLKMLGRISGVGKRTAERLMIELRDKVSKLSPEVTFGVKLPDAEAQAAEDALIALEQLGFKREKAQKCVHDLLGKLSEKDISSENLIKEALKVLNT